MLDERPLEKEAVRDVEALAATRPNIAITPLPDVRWTPQIRSISGPAPNKGSDRKFTALPAKRARSPRVLCALLPLRHIIAAEAKKSGHGE